MNESKNSKTKTSRTRQFGAVGMLALTSLAGGGNTAPVEPVAAEAMSTVLTRDTASVPVEQITSATEKISAEIDLVNQIVRVHPELLTIDPTQENTGRLDLTESDALGTDDHQVYGTVAKVDGVLQFDPAGDLDLYKSEPGSTTSVRLTDGKVASLTRGTTDAFVTATVGVPDEAGNVEITMEHSSDPDSSDTLPRTATAIPVSLENGISGFGLDIQTAVLKQHQQAE